MVLARSWLFGLETPDREALDKIVASADGNSVIRVNLNDWERSCPVFASFGSWICPYVDLVIDCEFMTNAFAVGLKNAFVNLGLA
jgi:hypothetical protein